MSVAVLCAIPPEWDHLHDAMGGARRERLGPFEFARGSLDGRDLVLAQAGLGKVNTAAVATLLVERFSARTILFSGVAGGLDPSLQIGDVVVGTRTVQHDTGVIENGRFSPYQAGHVPFFNPTENFGFACSASLAERAKEALEGLELPPLSRAAGGDGSPPRIVFGTVVTGDQYVHCDATRERLYREFEAQAVEMEGGALGQVGESLDVDWLDIRALSDLAGSTSIGDFGAFVHEVAASSATLLRRLLPVL